MEKQELIDALRETGIVTHDNDANGVRILLTVNDYESLSKKNRFAKAQFWTLIITAVCLLLTTAGSIFDRSGGYQYFKVDDASVYRYHPDNGELCEIPLMRNIEAYSDYKDNRTKFDMFTVDRCHAISKAFRKPAD